MNASAEIIYLIATVLFILAIKKLGKVESAKSGNKYAVVGMAFGILIILFVPLGDSGEQMNQILALVIVVMMFILGGLLGWIIAVKVKLTALPEMVSLLNALGGLCSMLIGIAEGHKLAQFGEAGNLVIPLSIFIGGVTTTGSAIAWGKLSGNITDRLKLPVPHWVNLILLLLNLIFIIVYPMSGGGLSGFAEISSLNSVSVLYIVIGALSLLTLIYGITFVLPIGGGDMPVVISFLNSLSGIAAAISGLLFQNTFMITGGILVGASGIFLTLLMCKAMNRTLTNVLIGGFGESSNLSTGTQAGKKPVKVINLDDLAVMLKYAKKVMIVPGYGLAVAQAQHLCKEIEKNLNENGVRLYYAIHPVAGRMPGHMNVLLAEAQISYENIIEMDEANSQFPTTNVVLVIGANDVVNTAAKNESGSPIYGMPILEVGQAETVVVLKRGMSTGYAGIDNPLFYAENTKMLFGDAKESLQKLKQAVAEA